MAKVKSLLLRKSSGKLAGTTMYTTSGVTIMREIATDVKNPRTKAQMTQRVKLANLVNTYQVLKRFFKYAFENKKPLTSDYNAFVAANLTNSPVYLTKQAAAANVVVPAPYRISEGTLPTLFDTTLDDGVFEGPLLSGLSSITSATTVAQVSSALLAAYDGLAEGMQISFIAIGCDDIGTNLVITLNEFVIDSSNTAEKILDFMPSAGVSNGYLSSSVLQGSDVIAGAFVVSQTVAGKTRVTTTSLVSSDTSVSSFVGSAALEAAINSYGESTDVFLDSNKANKA